MNGREAEGRWLRRPLNLASSDIESGNWPSNRRNHIVGRVVQNSASFFSLRGMTGVGLAIADDGGTTAWRSAVKAAATAAEIVC